MVSKVLADKSTLDFYFEGESSHIKYTTGTGRSQVAHVIAIGLSSALEDFQTLMTKASLENRDSRDVLELTFEAKLFQAKKWIPTVAKMDVTVDELRHVTAILERLEERLGWRPALVRALKGEK